MLRDLDLLIRSAIHPQESTTDYMQMSPEPESQLVNTSEPFSTYNVEEFTPNIDFT